MEKSSLILGSIFAKVETILDNKFGLLILIILLGNSYLAFIKTKSQDYSSALLYILTLGLALRLFTATDPFLHEWDERYHALVAKNTVDNPLKPTLYKTPLLEYDYKSWVGNHVWLHKQPFPIWIMACSISIFGNNIWGLRLPSVLLSVLAIWLTFLIGKQLISKKVGIVAAYLHAINGLIIEITGGRIATDHVDLFFVVLVEFGVFFTVLEFKNYRKLKPVWIGAFMGFAILTKWLPALLIMGIYFVFQRNKLTKTQLAKDILLLGTTAFIIAFPWQYYTSTSFPLESAWEKHFNWLHITQVLDEQGGPWYYFIGKLRINYGEIVYLPLMWYILKKQNWIQPKGQLLLMWLLVPIIFFSIPKTKMQAYTLFMAPALFIICGVFIQMLVQKRTEFIGGRKHIATTLLLLLFILPIRYCIERLKPFEEKNRSIPEYMIRLDELKPQLSKNTVIECCSNPIEVMFFCDAIAYHKALSPEERQLVLDRGFQLIKF